jgi:hypothetical protein
VSHGDDDSQSGIYPNAAREAVTNAAATLLTTVRNAAQNNPGTAATVAAVTLALTAGVAYAVHKNRSESPADAARQALTADHAV